jgi:hypothetical protein
MPVAPNIASRLGAIVGASIYELPGIGSRLFEPV